MTTAQIGKCGELLVQYKLLLLQIESAPLTTDSGIDLVAYSPRTNKPITIQVKTKLKPTPAGGKGKPSLDWWVPIDTPADIVAFVDLASEEIWLLTKEEMSALVPQKSSGRYHLCFYTDPSANAISENRRISDFESYRLSNRKEGLF
jgi:hypothetical protein